MRAASSGRPEARPGARPEARPETFRGRGEGDDPAPPLPSKFF